MNLLMRGVLSVSALLILAGAFSPGAASAQVYGEYGYYPYNSYYPYNYNYYSYNTGMLTVYVQVNNQYGGYRSPSDFTIFVSGAPSAQQYFAGAQNGTTLRFNGSYLVSVYNQIGYNPTYSSGCTGTLADNDTRTCYVTLTNVYNPYNYQYPTYPTYTYTQPAYVHQQPVTYVSKYVPSLPNTGFAPVSESALALMLAAILVAGALITPYGRKTLASLRS